MNLIYKNEKTLFGIMLALSLLIWAVLVLGTVGMALVYVLLFFIGYCFAQSALVSYLRGTAVQITPAQFPDLYQRIEVCCERLGLEVVPEAYLLQMGGAFNAFATRFLGNNFIVLYSDVVDALEERPDAINFYIGHEIGHIKRNHLRWSALLAPAALLPLLGPAYARAREYTCDRHGFHACDDLKSAQVGLAALAAGGKRWRQMSVGCYTAQAQQSSGFWMSFHELVGDYPWLVKRMAVVRGLAQGNEVPPPGRHGLAYLLALFVPRLGVGGAGSVLGVIAVIGVLAAVAIPAYSDYTAKARMAQAVAEGHEATAAVERYFYANGRGPDTLEQAGYAMDDPSHAVQEITVDGGNGMVRVYPSDLNYRGKAIAFTPRVDENKRVVWQCASEEIPARVLPPECHP
ncbi:Zn-dependent protease with chaperone function [Duganella sp. CF402]|uniref:M48 family metallopeptidase n=1 Tax=unclassified Duganella TaxID=2636909 RepID=UPI0008CD5748|nr:MULTISPECIES: M48 family metallopeptidase [unclassified Duganella]RZT06140.1 Zn-dependent protease with chaperone function [Duganella sp. BK701]SEM74588.1 Zn-dependent protease with chaperone function [Duganella sp. CF402]